MGWSGIGWRRRGCEWKRCRWLGLGFGLWLAPAKFAGSYIAQEMGLSIATQTNPSTGETNAVVGELLFALSVILFFLMDAHLILIRALFRSFDRFPLGGGIAFDKMLLAAQAVSESQTIGMQVVAPVSALLLLGTVAMGTMMKAIPQFNLFTFGTILRVFCGLLALFMLLPDVVLKLERVFLHMFEVIERIGL